MGISDHDRSHSVQETRPPTHKFRPGLFLTVSLSLSVMASASESSPSFASELERLVRPFLERHCVDCHGGEEPKGDLTLRGIQVDFSDAAQVDTWQAVLEKLELGEMPPKKRPRPDVEAVKQVTRWILRELDKVNEKPAIGHKRRSPVFGNRLDHEELFDGSHKGPAYSRSRLWRLGPHVYDRLVDGFGEGLRHAAAIHQPFTVDDTKGVIADYAAQHFADAATLQLLMMNCQTIAEYQTTGILRRRRDGRTDRERNTPREFREIIEADGTPGTDQLKAAIALEFQLLLERPPTEAEMTEAVAFCQRAIEKAGNARGLQTALMAILLKPEAVYRLEIGLGPKDEQGRRILSPYELAFALAYALTDKGPTEVRVRLQSDHDDGDDGKGSQQTEPAEKSLLDLAHTGGLSTPGDIRRVVKQILDDNNMADAVPARRAPGMLTAIRSGRPTR